MKKKQNKAEADRVLRMAVLAVVLLFLGAGLFVFVRMQNPIADSEKGKEKLAAFDSIEVEDVQTEIDALVEEDKEKEEALAARSNEEKFADCRVVGDSITYALVQNEILSSDIVYAAQGVGAITAADDGLKTMIENAIAAEPKKIFLAFGVNDVSQTEGEDTAAFIAAYKALTDEISNTLPDTVIYVNSIQPATEALCESKPAYSHIAEYNAALEELCAEEGMIFIDNTDLATSDLYLYDGLHFSEDYYPLWVDRMVTIGKL